MKPYERIKAYINGLGMKQKAVAEKAGYSDRQFSLMLTGKKAINVDDLEKICIALKVDASEFIKPDSA